MNAEHLRGNLWMLGAAVCWASATVASRRVLRQVTPLQLAFGATLLATPIHLLLFADKLLPTMEVLMDPSLAISTIYSGMLSTGLAYVTWHYGVRQVGASHASAYQNVVTLVGVIGGWLVLQEHVAMAQIIGGLSIVIGLLLMRRDRPL